MLPDDSTELRKQRGAFFTPYAIAEFLSDWALRGRDTEGLVLDPTCGEGVFLLAAARRLVATGHATTSLLGQTQLFGLDVHQASLDETRRLLADDGEHASELLHGDFFLEPTPDQLGARLPFVDAVIGNPPFVRYQEHRGEARRYAVAAALSQGVRLSGLASSWAALLVHASGFLKPDGRIAIVLPAELLSVGYAEPIRRWLRQRFQSVHLVLFDRLQFADAEEQVVLLVARGSGGCNAFTLHQISDASELAQLHIFDAEAFAPQAEGKWTDLLVPERVRSLLRSTLNYSFTPMTTYGTTELGTVTGANKFFTLSEATRREYGLEIGRHVVPTVPPGTRHLHGLRFTAGQWEQLRLQGERVWMLNPSVGSPGRGGLARYLRLGEELGVPEAYKCTVRTPWWRPPVQPKPDFFFTYMSHITPRLIRNEANVTFVNSMHGVVLHAEHATGVARDALPLLALNTLTMIGAEVNGRAYGGGVLKMEPREAAHLPVPSPIHLNKAWQHLKDKRQHLEELVKIGSWQLVTDEVDNALLTKTLHLDHGQQQSLRSALKKLRTRRLGPGRPTSNAR